jgi:peroxiredoxin
VFRATLETPGGELPFGLEIAQEGEQPVLFLTNGPERVRVPEVKIAEGTLTADMPGYENTLTMQEKDGVLTGTVKILRKHGEWKTLALRGERGKTHRFFAPSAADGKVDAVAPAATTPVANVAGRWSVVFTDDQGKPSAGVAELQQAGALVTGTVLTPTGDHRFLAGEVHGDELLLSRFDGGTAFMYKLKLTAKQQELSGHVFYGNWSADAVQARRDASAVLPDASMLTHLRNPGARFDFTFPDLEGKPVSLSDARFNDQVVIVMLGGSWCPNCHDETTFMAPFVKAREDKGLAAVMLMFEHFGDMPQAVQAVKRFQSEFGMTYPLLIAGTSDKDDAGTCMPQLDRVYAFPTTLVIDRQGRVRKIHTGFNGPATGEKYEQFQREFSAFIGQLLAEKP